MASGETVSGSPDATDFTVTNAAGAENTVTAATIAEDGASIALTLTNMIRTVQIFQLHMLRIRKIVRRLKTLMATKW